MAAKKAPAKKAPQQDRRPGMLSGNLASEPELRFTQSGNPVATLYLAVNERVKNEETGQWEDSDPVFHNVTVWRQQGERVCENLEKGDRIVAVGYWELRTFTDKESEEHSVWEFTAQEVGPSLLFRDAKPVRKVARAKGSSAPSGMVSEPPF